MPLRDYDFNREYTYDDNVNINERKRQAQLADEEAQRLVRLERDRRIERKRRMQGWKPIGENQSVLSQEEQEEWNEREGYIR